MEVRFYRIVSKGWSKEILNRFAIDLSNESPEDKPALICKKYESVCKMYGYDLDSCEMKIERDKEKIEIAIKNELKSIKNETEKLEDWRDKLTISLLKLKSS